MAVIDQDLDRNKRIQEVLSASPRLPHLCSVYHLQTTYLKQVIEISFLDPMSGQSNLFARTPIRKEKSHICSWPECRRSFGKFEHLQRHERSRRSYQCQLYPETANNHIQMLAMFDTNVRYVKNASSEGEYHQQRNHPISKPYIQ